MPTPRYITEADLISVAPPYLRIQLTDDNHDGSEDADVAAQAIEDAADEVDAVLSYRYHVPFSLTDPPPLVTWATKWIAWYNLHIRRSKMQAFVQTKYDLVIERLTAAVDPKANDIRSGIGVDPEPPSSEMVAEGFAIASSAPVMTRASLANPVTGY